MDCVAVIPARYGSSRLPGKVLLPLAGKPLVQHVWERVKLCPEVDDVFIATDDERVQRAVEQFGGKAVLTSPAHRSGTDRIAEATANLSAGLIVNVQGDEPLISPQTIGAVIRAMRDDSSLNMATACTLFHNPDELFDTNQVKVILDTEGFAICFSRLPIPFHRVAGTGYENYREAILHDPLKLKHFFKHVGLYVYQRDFLKIFVNLPQSFLECTEQLEQLRVIEHGYRIKVVEVAEGGISVDTAADYETACRRLEA